MKNKEIRFYNILFPIWMLMLMPTAWIAVLPINFIVDSLVILITMKAIGVKYKGKMYRKSILKVWIFGFVADMIGAGALLGAMYADIFLGDEIYITLPAMLIAALFIFIFNYKISFKEYDKATRLKMAINLAIFTAPYTFLIPISWIYS